MNATSERSTLELIAAARRDLEQVEAALARNGAGDWDRLLAAVTLARAARTADDATFSLLDSQRSRANPGKPSNRYTPRGYSDDKSRRQRRFR